MLLIYRSRSIVSKYQKQCMKVTRNTALCVLQQVTRDENRLFAPNEQAACLHLMLNQLGRKQNRTTFCILLKPTQVLCMLSMLLYTCKCCILLLNMLLYTSARLSMLLYNSKYYKCNAAAVAKRMQPPDYLLLNTPACAQIKSCNTQQKS